MSIEHARKFVEHLKTDKTLRAKVTEASEHIIRIAKEHGHEVTREDIKHVLKERWTKHEDESDDPAIVFSEAPGF